MPTKGIPDEENRPALQRMDIDPQSRLPEGILTPNLVDSAAFTKSKPWGILPKDVQDFKNSAMRSIMWYTERLQTRDQEVHHLGALIDQLEVELQNKDRELKSAKTDAEVMEAVRDAREDPEVAAIIRHLERQIEEYDSAFAEQERVKAELREELEQALANAGNAPETDTEPVIDVETTTALVEATARIVEQEAALSEKDAKFEAYESYAAEQDAYLDAVEAHVRELEERIAELEAGTPVSVEAEVKESTVDAYEGDYAAEIETADAEGEISYLDAVEPVEDEEDLPAEDVYDEQDYVEEYTEEDEDASVEDREEESNVPQQENVEYYKGKPLPPGVRLDDLL